MVKIARAAHHAHQRGILHRDLKPSNILLDANGEPYVTDFGLAKILETDISLTASDAIAGTPSFMSPEQAAGSQQLTTGTDVYSLGVILYRLLTGKLPFEGATPLETLRQVQEKAPTNPRTIHPHLDRDLETICLKCLEKAPEQRYDSAADLADDLECWLEGKPIVARPLGTMAKSLKWAKRNPLKCSLIAVLLCAVVGPLVMREYYLMVKLPEAVRAHPCYGFDRTVRGFLLFRASRSTVLAGLGVRLTCES